MNIESKSTFTITSWKDEPEELEGGMKLTRTKATQAYQGAISGNGMVEYLMYPGAKAIVHFVGFECITGTLDGKAGSFTIQHMGTFAGEPHSNWSVVPGSGTGELTGLAGKGSYAVRDGVMEMLFTYELGSNTAHK